MLDSTSVLRSRSKRWTIDRIARLAGREVTQLRTNAENLGEAQVVALCDQVLLLEPSRPWSDKPGGREYWAIWGGRRTGVVRSACARQSP